MKYILHEIEEEPNDSPERKSKDKADGVMIHVGGIYIGTDGKSHITGSYGCFTLAGKDSGNKGIKRLINDIFGRQRMNQEAKKGKQIDVLVVKREVVDWLWKASQAGVKITSN